MVLAECFHDSLAGYLLLHDQKIMTFLRNSEPLVIQLSSISHNIPYVLVQATINRIYRKLLYFMSLLKRNSRQQEIIVTSIKMLNSQAMSICGIYYLTVLKYVCLNYLVLSNIKQWESIFYFPCMYVIIVWRRKWGREYLQEWFAFSYYLVSPTKRLNW